MIKLFLHSTDRFICNRIKNVFEKTEAVFEQKHIPLDLNKELRKFEAEPLGCVIGKRDPFEKSVKLRIKLVIGFFFVLVPLTVFGLASYLSDINITFAVYATLIVAFLVANRVETLAKRYVEYRAHARSGCYAL